MIKQMPPPEGNSAVELYFRARAAECAAVTIVFAAVVMLAAYMRWYAPALAAAAIYLLFLAAWVSLSVRNRPVNVRWQSTEPGRAGSGELWQLYGRITELKRSKARWTESGDTAVEDEGQETDNAVALYKHPLLVLLKAPGFLVAAFGLSEMYKYLHGGNTLVALQYPDLHFSGSLDAWRRIEPGLAQLLGEVSGEGAGAGSEALA